MTGQNNAPVLAIDIGGTKMMAAVITSEGRMLASDVCPTRADKGVSSIIERLFATIDELLGQDITEVSDPGGIGIACAGGIDTVMGMITQSPNLPGWHDVPLAEIVSCKHKDQNMYRYQRIKQSFVLFSPGIPYFLILLL